MICSYIGLGLGLGLELVLVLVFLSFVDLMISHVRLTQLTFRVVIFCRIQNLKGKVRNVRSRDGLNIWCPKDYSQAVKTQGQVLPSNLYFALYKVETKEEYDQCDATKGEQLLVCNDPEGKTTSDKEDILLYFTERSLSQDRGVYIPGNTYYYIGK